MVAINRRLIFWLIKAYLKKWRKTIFFGFLLGLVFFFFLHFFISTLIAKIPLIQKETIGIAGAYTVDTLPPLILKDVSRGLTSVGDDGQPHPDLASSWELQQGGKEYIFHLKHGIYFPDGSQFSSKDVRFNFSDVSIQRPNSTTIIFILKEPYAPFLTTMSKPVFKDGFAGLGPFQIKDIQLNGNFVASLTLAGTNQPFHVKIYQFYPTQESLRLAFILGNVSKITGISDLSFRGSNLSNFPNAQVTKETNYHVLVTLFYNTQDKILSDKRLRDALSYALPNEFAEGVRAKSPIPPNSWAYVADFGRSQDFDHANLLLNQVTDSGKNKIGVLEISTLAGYKNPAEEIIKSWEKIGVHAKLKIVTENPQNFQIFLGNFNVPKDPDQYALWHSDQEFNITGYKSLRIDKLLEDGRKTVAQADRVKIYSDFQKYLLDDQPASFLYFPTAYTVTRK